MLHLTVNYIRKERKRAFCTALVLAVVVLICLDTAVALGVVNWGTDTVGIGSYRAEASDYWLMRIIPTAILVVMMVGVFSAMMSGYIPFSIVGVVALVVLGIVMYQVSISLVSPFSELAEYPNAAASQIVGGDGSSIQRIAHM